jgi:Transcriptional regulator
MSDKSSQNLEDKILEAAEILFLEQGFVKTTTGQIAKMAGCNQALVHYYYRTKDKLFDQVFEKKIKETLPNLMRSFDTADTFKGKISNLVEAHFDALLQNPKLFPFIFNEATSNPQRVQSMVKKVSVFPMEAMQKIGKELEDEIEKGNIAKISLMDLLLTIGSLNLGFVIIISILKNVMSYSEEQIDSIMRTRKKEIVNTIQKKLEP